MHTHCFYLFPQFCLRLLSAFCAFFNEKKICRKRSRKEWIRLEMVILFRKKSYERENIHQQVKKEQQSRVPQKKNIRYIGIHIHRGTTLSTFSFCLTFISFFSLIILAVNRRLFLWHCVFYFPDLFISLIYFPFRVLKTLSFCCLCISYASCLFICPIFFQLINR